MKTCPLCGTRYSDDTLSFCLQDGTPLEGLSPETPTVFLGETETVAAQRDPVRVPVGSNAWNQSVVTSHASPPQEKKGFNTVLAVALTAGGMLLLFGIFGIAAIVFLRNSQQVIVQNINTPPNVNLGFPNTNDNPRVLASATTGPVRSPTAFTPPPTPSPSTPTRDDRPPTVLSSYPSTTRLKFSRGSYSTSFGGDINPGDQRSLVLSCRSGQSLSANLTSAGGCVTIRGGGNSMRTTTSGGDNYVTVSNNCSSVARFTISISVI
jgi:hypothetical protein